MLGFRLGFGGSLGPFRAFGASGPVEVLVDLGGAIDFSTKKRTFFIAGRGA